MYYLRARLMNPLTGRFWTADDFDGKNRDAASLHKYLYCEQDPVNQQDPSGFTPTTLDLSMGSLIGHMLREAGFSAIRATVSFVAGVAIQWRIESIVDPLVHQLGILADEIDGLDSSGKGSKKIRNAITELKKFVSLGAEAITVLMPTIISGFSKIGGALFLAVRLFGVSAGVLYYASLATEGGSFTNAHGSLEISTPIDPSRFFFQATNIFFGALDPTEELALPTTELIQAIRRYDVNGARYRAKRAASKFFTFGFTNFRIKGNVGPVYFNESAENTFIFNDWE